jgi:hypothetical protein
METNWFPLMAVRAFVISATKFVIFCVFVYVCFNQQKQFIFVLKIVKPCGTDVADSGD